MQSCVHLLSFYNTWTKEFLDTAATKGEKNANAKMASSCSHIKCKATGCSRKEIDHLDHFFMFSSKKEKKTVPQVSL